MHPSIVVVPATADRWPELAALFRASGDSAHCWCAWFRLGSKAFGEARVLGRREAFETLVLADAVPGLLAYRDARLVGWCPSSLVTRWRGSNPSTRPDRRSVRRAMSGRSRASWCARRTVGAGSRAGSLMPRSTTPARRVPTRWRATRSNGPAVPRPPSPGWSRCSVDGGSGRSGASIAGRRCRRPRPPSRGGWAGHRVDR